MGVLSKPHSPAPWVLCRIVAPALEYVLLQYLCSRRSCGGRNHGEQVRDHCQKTATCTGWSPASASESGSIVSLT